LQIAADPKEPNLVLITPWHSRFIIADRFTVYFRPRFNGLIVAKILFAFLIVVCVIFIVITTVFGSKSDAMSGGSSQIRTTYRGKPGFDDFMSRATLYLGIVFMALCLIINVIQQRLK
jgi:protein translocase SecG subunit